MSKKFSNPSATPRVLLFTAAECTSFCMKHDSLNAFVLQADVAAGAGGSRNGGVSGLPHVPGQKGKATAGTGGLGPRAADPEGTKYDSFAPLQVISPSVSSFFLNSNLCEMCS